MPDGDGIDRLPELVNRNLAVIMLTGQGNERIAVEAMKGGAYDYLVKDAIQQDELLKSIHQTVEKSELKKTVETQRLQLAQHAEELQEINRELEQFAYSASHDLQEPLRSIGGFTGLLSEGYADSLDERGLEYLQIISSSAKRMQGMIEELLEYSRIQSKDFILNPTSLDKLIGNVKIHLHQRLHDQRAEIVAKDLPTVIADRDKILKVLIHLTDNGLKFNTSEKPEVRISAERFDDEWEICVTDNGIGIEGRFQDRIFEVFRRLHTRTEYEGNGIGLALCKRILQRQGSDLILESTPGVGTKIRFRLPASDTPPTKIGRQSLASSASLEQPRSNAAKCFCRCQTYKVLAASLWRARRVLQVRDRIASMFRETIWRELGA